jgi:hypothetical protein
VPVVTFGHGLYVTVVLWDTHWDVHSNPVSHRDCDCYIDHHVVGNQDLVHHHGHSHGHRHAHGHRNHNCNRHPNHHQLHAVTVALVLRLKLPDCKPEWDGQPL